jgi:hypothetical protein
MEKVTVQVGSLAVLSNGARQDSRRPVEFVGEQLATRTEYGSGDHGLTDTRGVTETLYKAEDGRFIVYVEDWSRWQGEPNHYSLREASAEDLGPGGRYEDLGREAGMGRPLTLDEALEDA